MTLSTPVHARPHPLRRRAATVAATAAAVVLVTGVPASAHVTASSPDAAPGGFGKVVLRVPTESDTARTTKVSVTLPQDTPFAFVSSKPVAGWTATLEKEELDEPVKAGDFTLDEVARTVTWTAAPGQGLGPGEFGEFELSVGPFPEKPTTVALPTTQSYSDGTSVAWEEPTEEGGEEPEHPAPTLEIEPAEARQTPQAVTAPASAEADDTARWLGGAGLVLGATGLGVALLGRRRRTP